MFLAFPLPGTNEEINEARLRTYWETLSKIEPEFVIEACEYARQGKFGEGRFLPSSGELYQLAEELRARSIRERKVFEPPIETLEHSHTPGERQRIIDGFAKLLADLRSGTPINPGKATADVFYPNPVE